MRLVKQQVILEGSVEGHDVVERDRRANHDLGRGIHVRQAPG